MRLGQIGCGRQNPPIQRAELASSRISMAKGIPSTSLQDWKAATAPLLPQKRRWYDAGDYRIDRLARSSRVTPPGCVYPSRWLPWLRRCAQRTQVCLKLMIIRVNLQFLYRRPNQYKRKLSEWDIQTVRQKGGLGLGVPARRLRLALPGLATLGLGDRPYKIDTSIFSSRRLPTRRLNQRGSKSYKKGV
ncbi:Hypothetical_protein [Hexamita inflata]|uniref:Hypothetical_protein n=1 Tax=Hexamita inflata TaxID=28002 RepID=A0AA86RJV9_9EUKA|nr:Hypothetical protein HINF_LOCUS62588 [Hexamita inflata]